MGTGWRRARNALGLTVCTSIPRDDLDALDSASPRESSRDSINGGFGTPRLGSLSFGDGGGGVSSPRLQQLDNVGSVPRLQCQTSPSPRLRCQIGGNGRTQSSLSQVSSSSPRMCSQSQCSPRLQCRTSASPRVRNIENVPLTEGSVPSSPRSPSRLSLLRNSIRLSRSTCAMCLQTMKPGQGHAIFTAECSHAFHFPCIASNVKHGNLVCPVCKAKWKEVPSQVTVGMAHKEEKAVLTPRSSSRRNSNNVDNTSDLSSESSFTPRASRQIASSEPLYDDDEPLDPNPRPNGATTTFTTIHEEEEEFEFKGFVVEPEAVQSKDSASETRNVEISIQPEVQVLAAGKSCDNFTVLLQVRAPPANPPQLKKTKQNSPSLILDPNYRASIDLVTVLDISGSMSGTKLQLLKRAMRLVVSSLSPADRLSVVVFSASAKRVFPLRRMAPQGQRAARRVIDRLVCSEGTNVPDALKKATKILEDRRNRNPVASIMLLSDGQDKRSFANPATNHSDLTSIRQSTRYGHIEIPVHAFGFGSEQNSSKMHTISSESGAEDAFAQCIGGLLSVVVQDLQLTVSCYNGIDLQSIYAGSFQTRVLDAYGTVKLGDLYADEERDIIVELKIPAVRYPSSMNVLRVNCSFKDPVTQQVMYGKEQSLSIPRPESIRGFPNSVNFQVDKYKIKLRTAQAIGEARTLADRGDANGAQQVLYKAKAMLHCATAATRTVDQMRSALEAEIKRIQAKVIRERENRDRIHRESAITPTSSSVLDIIMRYETDSNGEPLTPTSAWRAAERLAKVAMMRKSLNRVSDLHGFENARF